MTGSSEEHGHTSREMLAKAEEAVAQDDILQASEKGWGAAAHMTTSVAEWRGWSHTGHRELYLVVNRLAQETGDGELRTLFDNANSLHSNFYENWMPREWIDDGLGRVREFLDKLE